MHIRLCLFVRLKVFGLGFDIVCQTKTSVKEKFAELTFTTGRREEVINQNKKFIKFHSSIYFCTVILDYFVSTHLPELYLRFTLH